MRAVASTMASSGAPLKRGGHEWRKGLVVLTTARALLFFDDASVREVFVPLRIVRDWRFTADDSRRELRIDDLQRNDEVSLEIPRWFLIKEKMIA